jgi:hypothetical protein
MATAESISTLPRDSDAQYLDRVIESLAGSDRGQQELALETALRYLDIDRDFLALANENLASFAPFVFPIAYTRGGTRHERIDLLSQLAARGDDATKWRVLEVAERFSPQEAKQIVQSLANDRDEGIRRAAIQLS